MYIVSFLLTVSCQDTKNIWHTQKKVCFLVTVQSKETKNSPRRFDPHRKKSWLTLCVKYKPRLCLESHIGSWYSYHGNSLIFIAKSHKWGRVEHTLIVCLSLSKQSPKQTNSQRNFLQDRLKENKKLFYLPVFFVPFVAAVHKKF